MGYGALAFGTPSGAVSTSAATLAPDPASMADVGGTPAVNDPGSTGGLLDAIDAGQAQPSAQPSHALQRIADGFDANGARP